MLLVYIVYSCGYNLFNSSVCLFVGRLGLDLNLDLNGSAEILQTPAPRSTRPTLSRRRVRQQESSSDEESSPTSVVPSVPGTIGPRSQRASKTAALTKMTATKTVKIDEDEDEDGQDEDEDSEVTSDDNSKASDQFTE